jgi:transcriptional regulator with XRE-family HTH domain
MASRRAVRRLPAAYSGGVTDQRQARASLGATLRALRNDADLTVRALAALLSWAPSMVSKLETGRQGATPDDLRAWARATGQPQVTDELLARLRTLDSHYTAWRRQLATGTRARAEAAIDMDVGGREIWAFETAVIPGLLQTGGYAHHMLTRTAALHGAPRADIDEAVRARLERQQVLYDGSHKLRMLLWEPALHMFVCPPGVMREQIDRLSSLIGLPTIDLAVVELGIDLPAVPGHGFWIHDRRLVLVETIGAELRVEERTEVELYMRVFDQLSERATHGADVRRVLARAAYQLDQWRRRGTAG